MQRLLLVCLATTLAGFVSSSADAQNSVNGLFGQRNIGGGFSQRPVENFGSPGDRIETMQSGAGEVSGNERFVRGNRQAGDFVGADNNDARNFFSALQGQGSNALGNFGPNRNNQNANRQQANRGRTNGQTQLRNALRLGFAPTASDARFKSELLTTRLADLGRIKRVTPLEVALRGRTAVLTGSVATEHDREILARVLLLEPGVDAVENRLTVGPPPALEQP
jgi:osmotically-inducible protein OsmY